MRRNKIQHIGNNQIYKQLQLYFICFLLGIIIVVCSQWGFSLQSNAQPLGKWDFAARVMPNDLIQQVRNESVAPDWIGDPRRFSAVKYIKDGYEFYVIWTNTDCTEKRCIEGYHNPTCGASGICRFVGYAKRNGRYDNVLMASLRQQVGFDENFSSVSDRWVDGVPDCIKLKGADSEHSPQPPVMENPVAITQYCYDAQLRALTYRNTEFIPRERLNRKPRW